MTDSRPDSAGGMWYTGCIAEREGMMDTLNDTLAKFSQQCEHGRAPDVFCDACHGLAIEELRRRQREADELVAWAMFHEDMNR